MNEEDLELSKNYKAPFKEYHNEFNPLNLKQLKDYYRTILRRNKGQPYLMLMKEIQFSIDFVGIYVIDIIALEHKSYGMKFNTDTGYLSCSCNSGMCIHKTKLLNVFRKTLTT